MSPKVERRLPVHAMIPDTQVKPGVPTDHLRWIGRYLADSVQPDVIIHIGDHWDMPSLSSWDKGKKQFEGRRYEDDIQAGNRAFDELDKPLRQKRNYNPRKVLLRGNHENRLQRMLDFDPFLYGEDGINGLSERDFESPGWEVRSFLEVVDIDGVSYSHYFYNPMTGRPYGGTAINRLKTIGHSFTMGHQQIYDIGVRHVGTRQQRALIAGACYLHDEEYRGPQGNSHWRGIIIKHEVHDGSYDLMEVSLEYLCQRYEGMTIAQFLKKNYHAPTTAYGTWRRK